MAILFCKNFEYKILNVSIDNDGNKILIDLEIYGTKFRLINIYGPNRSNGEFLTP